MSSILKALKKLEDEQVERSAASLTDSGSQFVAPVRSGQSFLLLISGIGAGLLVAGGLYVMYGRSAVANAPPLIQEQVAGALAQPVPAVVPAAAAKVETPVPVRRQPVVPAAIAARPVAPAVPQTAANAVPVKNTTNATVETPLPARAEPRAHEPSQANPVTDIQVEHREIPAPGQQWSAPNLVVSDIMPASGGGRMAIVNGMPVMEGTMIDETLVEKIGEHQVVFVVAGRTVTVPVQPAIEQR